MAQRPWLSTGEGHLLALRRDFEKESMLKLQQMNRPNHATYYQHTICLHFESHNLGLERFGVDQDDLARFCELWHEYDSSLLLLTRTCDRTCDQPRLEHRLVADKVHVRRSVQNEGVSI